jgi:hypothetical protein
MPLWNGIWCFIDVLFNIKFISLYPSLSMDPMIRSGK